MAAAKQTLRFYQNSHVSTEVKDALTHSVLRHAGGLLAQRASAADEGHLLMGVNNTDTVMTELGHAVMKEYPYSPYGHRPARSESNIPLAFNGESLDSATGCYALGNGYRLYNPTIERFYSPDNLSPFGKGGLNAYMYCAGDPVNRVDPTGHLSFAIIRVGQYTAIATGVVGAGLTIAGMFKKSKKLQLAGGLLSGVSLLIMGAVPFAIRRARIISARAPSAPRPGLNSSRMSTRSELPPAYDPPPDYEYPPAYANIETTSPPTRQDAARALQPILTEASVDTNLETVSVKLRTVRGSGP